MGTTVWAVSSGDPGGYESGYEVHELFSSEDRAEEVCDHRNKLGGDYFVESFTLDPDFVLPELVPISTSRWTKNGHLGEVVKKSWVVADAVPEPVVQMSPRRYYQRFVMSFTGGVWPEDPNEPVYEVNVRGHYDDRTVPMQQAWDTLCRWLEDQGT